MSNRQTCLSLLLLFFILNQLRVRAVLVSTDSPVTQIKEVEFHNAIRTFCDGKADNFCSKQNLGLIFKVRKEKLEKEIQGKLLKLKNRDAFLKDQKFRIINELFSPRRF